MAVTERTAPGAGTATGGQVEPFDHWRAGVGYGRVGLEGVDGRPAQTFDVNNVRAIAQAGVVEGQR